MYAISNSFASFGFGVDFTWDLPVVSIPLSEDGSMLPSGNMSVKTTINVDVPSTYSGGSGGTLDQLEF